MSEGRKIIIPIGNDPDPKVAEQSFFNTEATKSAQPVVPLAGPAAMASKPAKPKSRGRKLAVVAVVLLVFAGLGIAAGGYFYLTRNRAQTEPQVAVQPVAGKTLAMLPWTHTPEDPAAEENTNVSSEDGTEQTEQTARNDTRTRNERAVERDQKKSDKRSKKKNENDERDPVKRTQEELNRIREIFEGTP